MYRPKLADVAAVVLADILVLLEAWRTAIEPSRKRPTRKGTNWFVFIHVLKVAKFRSSSKTYGEGNGQYDNLQSHFL